MIFSVVAVLVRLRPRILGFQTIRYCREDLKLAKTLQNHRGVIIASWSLLVHGGGLPTDLKTPAQGRKREQHWQICSAMKAMRTKVCSEAWQHICRKTKTNVWISLDAAVSSGDGPAAMPNSDFGAVPPSGWIPWVQSCAWKMHFPV